MFTSYTPKTGKIFFTKQTPHNLANMSGFIFTAILERTRWYQDDHALGVRQNTSCMILAQDEELTNSAILRTN